LNHQFLQHKKCITDWIVSSLAKYSATTPTQMSNSGLDSRTEQIDIWSW
jgi:hypothetical protein